MKEDATQRGTVMIAAFEGWNDACQAATNVIRHLTAIYASCEVRRIRCDGFYDYQQTRPIVCHATGRRRIVWPQTAFYDIEVAPDRHVIAQLAPEPNYRWREYCLESLRIADELDVTHIVTLGSMFADCPHTRPLPVDVDCENASVDPDQRYSGPVGIPTILDDIASQEGFDTTTMWASIPQYLGDGDCPQATLELLDRISELLGVCLETGDLPRKADEWRSKASMLAQRNDALNEYVRHLEAKYDRHEKARREASLGGPACEQLVREAEAFLKDLD
ncbi:PAC2 family protein [Bifidobacterium amazonense]|uniref:PAC2 family protein n=1 Tax=Bifidobacterium amazonense TaxID=2809027 RepID=A0ABS9VSG9_9BIFI|nr:PAC2 family protein [Bifidobacterium amazonense]MCH9275034.1 PAC2 family protein [Bifidobacterium amazonense]